MTKLALLIFLFFHFSSFGQKAAITFSQIATLKDSAANCVYTLDSSHTNITAYNSHGQFLWNFYTCNGSTVPDENIKPVEIYAMKLEGIILWISYTKCVGSIDVKTGKFHPGDCD